MTTVPRPSLAGPLTGNNFPTCRDEFLNPLETSLEVRIKKLGYRPIFAIHANPSIALFVPPKFNVDFFFRFHDYFTHLIEERPVNQDYKLPIGEKKLDSSKPILLPRSPATAPETHFSRLFHQRGFSLWFALWSLQFLAKNRESSHYCPDYC